MCLDTKINRPNTQPGYLYTVAMAMTRTISSSSSLDEISASYDDVPIVDSTSVPKVLSFTYTTISLCNIVLLVFIFTRGDGSFICVADSTRNTQHPHLSLTPTAAVGSEGIPGSDGDGDGVEGGESGAGALHRGHYRHGQEH